MGLWILRVLLPRLDGRRRVERWRVGAFGWLPTLEHQALNDPHRVPHLGGPLALAPRQGRCGVGIGEEGANGSVQCGQLCRRELCGPFVLETVQGGYGASECEVGECEVGEYEGGMSGSDEVDGMRWVGCGGWDEVDGMRWMRWMG